MEGKNTFFVRYMIKWNVLLIIIIDVEHEFTKISNKKVNKIPTQFKVARYL